MARLIAIVGVSGVGKTTLTRQLCRLGQFITGLEQHEERPYQSLFAQHHQRYALPNQVDYFLLRAEQEMSIRQSAQDGIIDGGLDVDFHIFTQLFFQRGYLSQLDYNLCQRLYQVLRGLLPAPELMIYMTAPFDIIAERFTRRNRKLEIAEQQDIALMHNLLEKWVAERTDIPIIHVDASIHDPDYLSGATAVYKQITRLLAIDQGASA
jgi:deoxyadenosine/deoxycytidine kinase